MENRNVEHVVLDLETLGTVPGCGIIAIGAISLDLQHRFYEKIRPDSNKSFRLFSQTGTIDWWNKQSEGARSESFSGTKNLDVVLKEFSAWFVSLNEKPETIQVWGNGADLIFYLEGGLYEAALPCPIGNFSARCYRTMTENFPHIKKGKFIGETHTALADARHQAEHLNELLSFVKSVGDRDEVTYAYASNIEVSCFCSS
jgi:hypothetical protein